jgi:hypothetical protein
MSLAIVLGTLAVGVLASLIAPRNGAANAALAPTDDDRVRKDA